MVDLARLVNLGRRLTTPILVDTCTVRRDPQRRADDTIDPVTLELVRPAGDDDLIHEGPCAIVVDASRADLDTGRSDMLATPPDDAGRFQALLPITAPELRADDVLTVTSSVSSPQLVGRAFRVTGAPAASTVQVLWSVPLRMLQAADQ